MLWSLPARAQPPIVLARKWMFAARRISAASDSVIQSAAATGQSAPLDAAGFGGFDSPASTGFVSDVEVEPEPLESLSPDAEDFLAVRAAWRSFLAQPEPLKTIVGGANVLRIVPSAPQAGQNRGPSSLMPRMMSVRWPQALQ
jgi:hypothetical protein